MPQFAKAFGCTTEELRAVVKYRPAGGKWKESPMRRIDAHLDGDTWEGSFAVDACGNWQYSIEAWIDPLASWRHEVHRKLDGGQTDVTGELSEGALLIAAAAERAKAKDATLLAYARHLLVDPSWESPAAAMSSDWLLLIPFGIIALSVVGGFLVFRREAPRVAEDL